MYRVHLKDKFGRRWTHVGSSSANGYAFWHGQLLVDQTLAHWLARPETRADWAESLRQANGTFQVVFQEGDRLWAAVDRLRSMPLFYAVTQGEFLLSDDAYWLREQLGDTALDDVAVAEFHSPGYVTGPDTLYPSIKQLQAGEGLQVQDGPNGPQVTCVRYYRYLHHDLLHEGIETFTERNAEMLEGVARRFIESVNGRTVVIPLSGGYDSRLVALMLKKHGYENVICFSYGQVGARNAEAEVSRHVAESLGYRWLFVPYSNAMWREFFQSDGRRSFDRYADNLVSLPHDQDLPAIRQLQLEGKLPDDSVVVPGHSGDFLAGTHILKHKVWLRAGNPDDLLRAIQHEHYPYFRRACPTGRDLWPQAAEKILFLAGDRIDGTAKSALDACECWDWQERQAKYIVNAVRVYEFFGYGWRIPLWDAEMLALWERVPLTRDGTALYEAYVVREGAKFGLKPNPQVFRAHRTFLRKLSRRLRLESFARSIKNRSDYDNDQMAFFGIIPQEELGAYGSLYAPFKFYYARTRIGEIREGR